MEDDEMPITLSDVSCPRYIVFAFETKQVVDHAEKYSSPSRGLATTGEGGSESRSRIDKFPGQRERDGGTLSSPLAEADDSCHFNSRTG
jgi:hypothetical protein